MASIAGDVIAFLNLIAAAVLKQAESCRGRAASVAAVGWSSPAPLQGGLEGWGILKNQGFRRMQSDAACPPGAEACWNIF